MLVPIELVARHRFTPIVLQKLQQKLDTQPDIPSPLHPIHLRPAGRQSSLIVLTFSLDLPPSSHPDHLSSLLHAFLSIPGVVAAHSPYRPQGPGSHPISTPISCTTPNSVDNVPIDDSRGSVELPIEVSGPFK